MHERGSVIRKLRVVAYLLPACHVLDFVTDLAGHRVGALPVARVPSRFFRRMLLAGRGDATRAICSTLIAQAFRSIQYLILPGSSTEFGRMNGQKCGSEDSNMRRHILFAPLDF